MSNLAVSATTTPYAVVRSTTGSSSSTTVSSTSSATTKTVTSSTTPSSSTTANQTVSVATSSNTATLSSSTTYAYGSSASNSISRMVSSTTVYATSSSTTPNVTSRTLERNGGYITIYSSSSATPSVTSSSTTPSVSSSSTTLPPGTIERNGGVITILTSSSTTPSVTSLSTTPQVSSSGTTPMQLYSEKNVNNSELEMTDMTDDIISEEPYTGNVSETMKSLIQTEYEYMLNPEEYAEHLEQEKQRIEELNSLKDEDVFAGMSYEEIIRYRYENAINEKCKALYEKYKDSIDVVEYYEEGDNRYNFVTNNIRLNKDDDMKNVTGYASIYFHEVGHCMDDYSDTLMGISGNSSYDFYDVLKADYEAFLNKAQEENGLTRDEAYIWVENWLKEDVDIKSAVADIIVGLSEHELDSKWGHDKSDYTKSMIEKEAFANFFDAGMSYKPLKQMYIQEVFPNAHKVFEKMITDGLQKEPYTILPHRMIVV